MAAEECVWGSSVIGCLFVGNASAAFMTWPFGGNFLASYVCRSSAAPPSATSTHSARSRANSGC